MVRQKRGATSLGWGAMMRLTGQDLAAASSGKWLHDMPDYVQGIGSDTREFQAGEAFLALRGPSFDGHEHAYQIADQAVALIGDEQGLAQWKHLEIPQLKVQDTLQCLGDVAALHRSRLCNTQVVAITGSYGKTTVRSMLEIVLKYLNLHVAATQANYNNLIGVPQTLLGVGMQADVALIECGISEQGEMLRLSEIVQPDMVIVTGLSQAHSEGLGGFQGVVQEKSKLMTYLREKGWAVLGQGVLAQFEHAGCMPKQPIVSMGEDTVAWQLDGQVVTLTYAGQKVAVNILLPAQHWAEDMALVATVVLKLGEDMGRAWSLAEIGEALRAWQPVDGRLMIYNLAQFTLIDDAYNANPASMQAALDTLASLEGHRIAIIGDMLELGKDAAALHQKLNLHDIDEVFTVGSFSAGLQTKWPEKKIHVFRHVDDIVQYLKGQSFPRQQSTVLVKASRGTGLQHVVKTLQQRGQHVI
ncbi:MAG: UDP-N-acetylmuramoyl-tripeptide--D-alanyl-D-alanine ligase [Ghiorsea sp.]|nr:UDP-N-acetylmuramoyl-tripeptide--D-alanyl-D-alanine ligase [Ghiorsea sp.]